MKSQRYSSSLIKINYFDTRINYQVKKKKLLRNNEFKGCLVCVFKQPFSIFKQHFTHFHTFFHRHVFLQIFLNNNF